MTKFTKRRRISARIRTFLVRLVTRRGIKSGTRCGMRPDKLSLVVRRSRRVSKDISSRHIMSLAPAFILKAHNQISYKCLMMTMRLKNKNGDDALSRMRPLS